LLERFHAIGLPILEAYGLSENIIPVSLNRSGDFRFGTVGRPLPGCEVRLADDGELLVRGPGVFKTYLGADTSEARVDANGFLLSGDFATIDGDGFITLIGRKSEIFKTSTGRRVAPARIESLLRQISGVEFAAVFGAGRTQPTALLAVNETSWHDKHDQLPLRLREQALHALEPLPPYLRPAGFALTTRLPTIAGGELTANLKMRRRIIEDNYAQILDELHMRLDKAAGAPFEAHSKDGLTLFVGL
jgi:long-chain acyl-CoA synthetase